MNFPFTEKIISEGAVERTFAKDINRDDLVWHRDKGDRHLVVVESVGWQFQMDNQLPINLEPGQELLVPAGNWHRVIKGSSPLRVIINKVAKIKESKMRITKTQLKQIINEELTVNESPSGVPSGFTTMCMESISILIGEGNAQGLRFVDSIGEIQRCLTELSGEGM